MPRELLPTQTVSFDNAGLQKLLALAHADPALAAEALKELEANPRATVIHLFRMSPYQTAALADMSDDAVRKRVAPIIAALRSGHLQGITLKNTDGSVYKPDPNEKHPLQVKASCTCKVEYTS